MKKDIIFELETLIKTIHRDFHEKDEKIPKTSPTLTQLKIFEHINERQKETVYQKDLENLLNVRRATVSEVLKTMEKNGFIVKKVNNNDLRSFEIKITAKAKKIFSLVNGKKEELNDVLTNNISDKDLETFRKVLKTMKNNIKENANDKTS